MVLLSDGTIKARLRSGEIRIETPGPGGVYYATGWQDGRVRPASVDVRIGNRLRAYRWRSMSRAPRDTDYVDVEPTMDGAWYIVPGVGYLAAMLESLTLPDDCGAWLVGRSSIARLFVSLHHQAGWIDPGWMGCPTLEITTLYATWLYPGQEIGQLLFMPTDQPVERTYGHPDLGSHYQGDTDPTPSRLWLPVAAGARQLPDGRADR